MVRLFGRLHYSEYISISSAGPVFSDICTNHSKFVGYELCKCLKIDSEYEKSQLSVERFELPSRSRHLSRLLHSAWAWE